tara:strand:- start:654 stop:1025 length:372 start_codon:yes stop_codon:yes gene_type:complete
VSKKQFLSRLEVITGKVESKITEFTVYSDLIVQEGHTRLQELGVEDYSIHDKAPSKCGSCGSKNIIDLCVLGALNETLLWLCDGCEALYLKIDKELTEQLLEQSSYLWTNPLDWETPPKGKLD